MADVKISELTALASANVEASGDVLAVVDTSATATRKITVENLLAPITINKASNVITNLGTVSAATSITSSAFVGPLTGNVTGNTSGTALTVTQAAQTAITSVGTLTGLTGGTGDLIWDTTTLVVDSSANRIGIGTALPTAQLSLVSGTYGFENLFGMTDHACLGLGLGPGSTSNQIRTVIGTTHGMGLMHTASATAGSAKLQVVTTAENSTAGAVPTRLATFLADGKVGILTDSPSHSLDILGTNQTVGSGSSVLAVFSSSAYDTANTGGSIGFQGKKNTGGDYSENAWIGGLKENTTDENDAGYLAFGTRPNGGAVAERMRITSAGHVMLGNQTMTDHTNQTLGLKGTSQSGVSAITFLTTSSPTAGRSFAWASNYTAHGSFDLRCSEDKDGTPFHGRILGIEGDTGHTTFLGRIQVGTFPQSTTNAGEAWIGRAGDREDGTLTVQLGGNADTDTKFEILDRAWSKVIFQVSGEAPSGAFNLNSSGTIATQSDVSGDYAMFVNQLHSTGWGLRIAGGADSSDYIIRGQNGSGNDRFLVTSDGALEIRNNMLIERSVWDEPQIRLDPSSNFEFRIGNYGTSGSKKFGIKNNDGTIIMESSGNNGNDFWFGGDVSAASFTDRTPYPETLKIAYDVLASHKKLNDYDKNDKQHQLDHTKLHDFAKPQITVSTGLPENEVVTKELGQDGRDASAVISCLVEVVNDLTSKIIALENA